MKRYCLYIIFLLGHVVTYAQTSDNLQKLITDIVENQAEGALVNRDYEELVNDLIYISQHPINLNSATKEDLERLFFLSDFQIENLLFYKDQYGPMYSVYELQGVERMDSITIRNLLPFITLELVDKEDKKKWVRGNVLVRAQSLIQTPEGYLPKNDSTPPAYIGSKEKLLTRARLNVNDQLELGFTLEKDQGEKAFPKYFPEADFTSAFVQLNKPLPFIETLIVGDYRLAFGQGLGVWSDMAMSKTSETAQLRRRPRGINPYTSVNENSFFRGGTIGMKFGTWSVSPFVSIKNRDASILTDTIGDQIGSLQETGYHRTNSELNGKNQIQETIGGANVNYKNHWLSIDAGYCDWRIDKPLASKNHLRDFFRFEGDRQESVWLAHSIFKNNLMVFGEVVMQNYHDYGIYQALTYNAGNDIVASLAYRRYSNGYTAILSNPFSESSSPGSETGVFSSLSFKPNYKLELKAFADVFSYKWLRYNTYRPSDGFECMVQGNYQISQDQMFYIRGKSTQKEINSSEGSKQYKVASYKKNSMRLFYSNQLSSQWRIQSQIDLSRYKQNEDKSDGWLFFQDLRYSHSNIYSISLRYILFDIEDYNSRIYNYEPDVLYAFTIPAYLNSGSRIILNGRVKLFQNLSIWGRLAHTSYRGLESIGSGYQQINGNQLTEWKVQVQYRF